MNLAFNRIETAAPDALCARVGDLEQPYATVMLLGTNEASSGAWFALQSAQKMCASVRAGRAPASADIQGFKDSVVGFLVAAKKDLAH
jgi:hypothetical protein